MVGCFDDFFLDFNQLGDFCWVNPQSGDLPFFPGSIEAN